MNNSELRAIIDKVKDYKSICLIGHIDPDPDALASMVAMKEFLSTAFNITDVDLFASCDKVNGELKAILSKTKLNLKIKEYDVAIIMDCPNISRVGKYSSLFERAKYTLVIDHHNTNTYFGRDNIVEICSSTCEIIFNLFKEYNINISDRIYERLYTGIITDTMSFTVGAMTKRTFDFAGECLRHCNVEKIYNYFLGSYSAKNIKMRGVAFNNNELYYNNRLALSYITREEQMENSANKDDYIGIVNQMKQIKGVQIATFITPQNDGYYVTMRSMKGIDISVIAKKYGGGGHVGAAAFCTTKSIEEIKQILLKEFKNLIKLSLKTESPYNN